MNQSETFVHPFDKTRIPFVDLARIFLGRKRYFCLGLTLCLLAALAITYTTEPQYRFTSLFQIGSLERNVPIQQPREAATFIEESLYPRAVQNLGERSGVGLTAEQQPQSDLISVVSVGPVEHADYINRLHKTVLNELLGFHQDIQNEYVSSLNDALSAAKAELDLIKQDGRQVNVSKAQIHRERLELQKQMVKVQDSKLVSLTQSKSLTSEWRWLINLLVGGVTGVFLGLFLVYTSELWAYTKRQLRDMG